MTPQFAATRIAGPGASVTSTGTSSAATGIPNNAAGVPARYVRVAVTAAGYIKFGPSGVVATTSDILIAPTHGENFAVQGQGDFFAFISVTGTAICNVTPVEF
jgi:hypothetical protein